MRYEGQTIVLQSNTIHSPDAGELEWQNRVVGYYKLPIKNIPPE